MCQHACTIIPTPSPWISILETGLPHNLSRCTLHRILHHDFFHRMRCARKIQSSWQKMDRWKGPEGLETQPQESITVIYRVLNSHKFMARQWLHTIIYCRTYTQKSHHVRKWEFLYALTGNIAWFGAQH